MKNIFDLTMGIEQIFGKPMDVEGVIKGDTVYVVQARPITTLGGNKNETK